MHVNDIPAIRLQKTEIKKTWAWGRHLLKQELAANMRTFCKRLTRSQAHACPVDVHYSVVKKNVNSACVP